MPTYTTDVELPEPPVPVTVLRWGKPQAGDYWWTGTEWKLVLPGWSNFVNDHYCFTPPPQPPKSVIGFKKGTKFRRGVGCTWEYSSVVENFHTLFTNLLAYQSLTQLSPSITSFTTTEDGTSL